jgi:hypothetical protein
MTAALSPKSTMRINRIGSPGVPILRQLVGYWLLDYDNKHRLESVGVVLMRHGHLQRFNIRDLLGTITTPNRLRAEFRDGLRRD